MGWDEYSNQECHDILQLQHYSTTNGAFQFLANVLVLLFILTTNALVLYGLFKTKQTKGFTNRMFIVISVSDLLCGCTVIPLYLTNIYLGEKSKDCILISTIEKWLYIFFSFGSSINTSALAVDRFIFIRYPFKYHEITSKRRILMLAVTLSYTIGLTMVFCAQYEGLFAVVAIFVIMLVLGVSIAVNVQLVKYIKKQTNEIRRLSNTFVKTSYKQRATKTIFMIIAILVVTHLPQISLLAYASINNSNEESENITFLLIFYWTRLLVLVNAGLNALVYISRNKLITKLYKRKFKLC